MEGEGISRTHVLRAHTIGLKTKSMFVRKSTKLEMIGSYSTGLRSMRYAVRRTTEHVYAIYHVLAMN